jgi:hypothetical protein
VVVQVEASSVLQRAPTSPAAELFTSLKGYPGQTRDVEMIQRLLHSTLKRMTDSCHALLKTIVTLKVGKMFFRVHA